MWPGHDVRGGHAGWIRPGQDSGDDYPHRLSARCRLHKRRRYAYAPTRECSEKRPPPRYQRRPMRIPRLGDLQGLFRTRSLRGSHRKWRPPRQLDRGSPRVASFFRRSHAPPQVARRKPPGNTKRLPLRRHSGTLAQPSAPLTPGLSRAIGSGLYGRAAAERLPFSPERSTRIAPGERRSVSIASPKSPFVGRRASRRSASTGHPVTTQRVPPVRQARSPQGQLAYESPDTQVATSPRRTNLRVRGHPGTLAQPSDPPRRAKISE
jgi:hypothetical protein